MKIPIKIKTKDNKVQQKNSMRGNFPGGGGGGGLIIRWTFFLGAFFLRVFSVAQTSTNPAYQINQIN